MERQGFDPVEKGFCPTVKFMENYEGLKDKAADKTAAMSAPKDKKSKGKENKSPVHGQN